MIRRSLSDSTIDGYPHPSTAVVSTLIWSRLGRGCLGRECPVLGRRAAVGTVATTQTFSAVPCLVFSVGQPHHTKQKKCVVSPPAGCSRLATLMSNLAPTAVLCSSEDGGRSFARVSRWEVGESMGESRLMDVDFATDLDITVCACTRIMSHTPLHVPRRRGKRQNKLPGRERMMFWST